MSQAAAHSLFQRRKDPLGAFLVGSVIGHAVLVGLIAVANAFMGPKVIDLDQKPIKASLVRLGKPRDQKLLPRKEELPPPPKKEEGAEKVAVPLPADKAVPVPLPGVKPTDKNSQKKPGEKDGADRRKQLFGAFDKAAKAGKVEELEGAEDGDPDGDSATAEGERYFGLLSVQVRRHYDVSNTISEAERIRLRAQVVLTIGRAGELTGSKLTKPSGNDLFDAAVLSAVKKASPFSPPPEHLRAQLGRDGVILEFKP
ncbi:MAG: energy transducer TonB [Myxococcota bacterium]